MLLLLLSFYVRYGLLNCEEISKAKFNESTIVDHHRRVLLEVNSLLKDLEQKTKKLSVLNADDYEYDIRRQAFISEKIAGLRSEISEKYQNIQNLKYTTEHPTVILPSTDNVRLFPHQDHPPLFPGSHAPPSVIALDSARLVKNPNEKTEPYYPGHQLIPMNSIYPSVRMPPSIFSKISHYVANDSYPLRIFRPTGPVLYKEPPSVPNFQIIPQRPIYASPSLPNFYISGYTALTRTIRTTTMSSNAKAWFNEIAPYTRDKRKKTDASEDQSRPWPMGTTVPIAPNMPEPKSDWSDTDYAAQLFNKSKYKPGITPKDPHENSMTTAGDVLYGKIKVKKPSTTQGPEQRHVVIMEQLEEGYLMVFAIEMFRLISVKAKHEVQEVLAPMRRICNSLSEEGRLDWVNDPLLILIEKLSTLASSGGNSIDSIRTYSSMMFHSLLQRTEMLSDEINSIIDHAELFFSVEEGRRLLRSLAEFEDYPNTSTPSYIVCANLIENILQPFSRPAVLRSRDRLLDSVNRALRRRFPLLIRKRIRSKGGTYRKRKYTKISTQEEGQSIYLINNKYTWRH